MTPTELDSSAIEQAKLLAKQWPYEYVGGGYYRQKGIPKGQHAQVLHGQEVIQDVCGSGYKPLDKFYGLSSIEAR